MEDVFSLDSRGERRVVDGFRGIIAMRNLFACYILTAFAITGCDSTSSSASPSGTVDAGRSDSSNEASSASRTPDSSSPDSGSDASSRSSDAGSPDSSDTQPDSSNSTSPDSSDDPFALQDCLDGGSLPAFSMPWWGCCSVGVANNMSCGTDPTGCWTACVKGSRSNYQCSGSADAVWTNDGGLYSCGSAADAQAE